MGRGWVGVGGIETTGKLRRLRNWTFFSLPFRTCTHSGHPVSGVPLLRLCALPSHAAVLVPHEDGRGLLLLLSLSTLIVAAVAIGDDVVATAVVIVNRLPGVYP